MLHVLFHSHEPLAENRLAGNRQLRRFALQADPPFSLFLGTKRVHFHIAFHIHPERTS